MSNKHTQVVIAGGGPVGVALSIALSNMGIDNTVVERDTSIHPLPRAAVIDAEIVRAFIQMGLGDELMPQLSPIRVAEYVDVDGNRLAGEDLDGVRVFGGLSPSSMHYQPDLEAMLRREMLKRGGRFIEGARFTGIDSSSTDSVSLLMEDGSRLEADYVVGCDGASSTVRRSLGIGWEDLGFNQDWLVVDIEVNDRATCGLPDVARQICDPRRPVTMIQGHERFHRWEFQLQPNEDPQVMNEVDNIWRLLSQWITPAKARIVRSAPYTFHAVVASTMRQGRVLLAGDAAHQMPPFMGQGLNSGHRDAINLAWKLSWVLKGWAGENLLDTYSAERRTHALAIIEQSVEAGQLIDQFAGRVSHGIAPREGYGGSHRINGYGTGVVVGDHPRVGRPFRDWHEIVISLPVDDSMVIASSVPVTTPLPVRGRWTLVQAGRKILFGADHVIVRPDGWVAAVCGDAELAQVLRELEGRLAV